MADRRIFTRRGQREREPVVEDPMPKAVPERRPPLSAPIADPLATLHRVRARQQQLDRDLVLALDAAVAAGHSYAEIGAALGVSRQAARQRHLRG